MKYALLDHVSDLKFSNRYLFVMCCLDLLLIGRDTDLDLLLPFLRVIQHQAELDIILVLDHSFHSECWHLMSTGMIASVLYANENGVSPVGTHLVVL